MAEYRITIEKDDGKRTTTTVLVAKSIYQLDQDIAEWVREEIDPGVIVTVTDDGRQTTVVEREVT